jgi:hypothetical protein
MEQRILQVVWSDRVMSAEVRQITNVKDIVAVAHSLKWEWGGNGPAQVGTCYINVGRNNRQKENKAAEDAMGRHSREWREDNGHEQPKTGVNGVDIHSICKSDISRNNSPSDETLELSLVPPGDRCLHRIN